MQEELLSCLKILLVSFVEETDGPNLILSHSDIFNRPQEDVRMDGNFQLFYRYHLKSQKKH